MFSIAQKPVAAGGNMPIDTGFLRESLQTGLNGSHGLTGPESYVFTIAGSEIGDTILGGWTVEYARHVHYGTRGSNGRMWVSLAAQHWQQIVADNAKRAEANGL